tara:strand:+ start:10253 stop:11152 length:900 start_codon:yes stop_codon:yes gene_type:complete
MINKNLMSISNKLSLGTAQMGMIYGINNLKQVMQHSDVKSILNYAKLNNFDLIDTAITYGNSEKILGKTGIENFKIISKLPQIPSNISNVNSWLIDQIESSMKRLKINQFYGLLLHHPSDLMGPHRDILKKVLSRLKSSGIVIKIGVSIYDPKELDNIYSSMKIDIVQSPLNIMDRRLETSGWLSKLHNEGVEVHVRSIFLQGLLLMRRNKIPLKFNRWSKIWDEWIFKLSKNKSTAAAVCLHYPMSLQEVDRVIVGVDNIEQLKDIVQASKTKIINKDWFFMTNDDQMLINPMNWNML